MARPTRTKPPQIDAVVLRRLPPLPPPGALDTLEDVQREWQRLHRGRARGQVGDEEFRSLAYSLQVGGALTRMREEIRVATAIVRQLEQLKSGGTVTYLPASEPAATESLEAELVPGESQEPQP